VFRLAHSQGQIHIAVSSIFGYEEVSSTETTIYFGQEKATVASSIQAVEDLIQKANDSSLGT
jgi:hypothetical protein